MNHPRNSHLLAVAASIPLALASCGPKADVEVERARLVLPMLPGRPAALYFIATSRSGQGKLTAIASRRAERIEFHETRTEKGVSRMDPLPGAGFDDTSRIDFAPGGKHAMVHGLDPSLKAGDKLPLTFTFEPGPSIEAEAHLVQLGEGHGAH